MKFNMFEDSPKDQNQRIRRNVIKTYRKSKQCFFKLPTTQRNHTNTCVKQINIENQKRFKIYTSPDPGRSQQKSANSVFAKHT